ncbi:unnamed protein product [Paramecium sonneborni]|uniref:Uncharacterized protein n=1 Tax=Paramecium sonneborni TaxID=65129 RepID=A0A8S1QZY5_9CILI|nr:unnamed protein product [Paramecium sonneborni]
MTINLKAAEEKKAEYHVSYPKQQQKQKLVFLYLIMLNNQKDSAIDQKKLISLEASIKNQKHEYNQQRINDIIQIIFFLISDQPCLTIMQLNQNKGQVFQLIQAKYFSYLDLEINNEKKPSQISSKAAKLNIQG